MLQDIGGHAFDNHYRAVAPAPGDRALVVRGGEVALATVGEVRAAEAAGLALAPVGGMDAPTLRFAFAVDGRPCFLAMAAEGDCRDEGSGATAMSPVADGESLDFRPVSWLRADAAPVDALCAATALTLARWYRTNRICPRCGRALAHAPASRELVCPACGQVLYPKIAPGVIAGVVDRQANRIVLTKYAHADYSRFALVAGFSEVGESLEGTVAREVAEEVGLSVKNLRFYASQPWPFTDTLLAGFFCEVDGARGIRLDTHELREAVWCAPRDMPSRADDRVSLTGEMMRLFAQVGARVLDPGVRWEGPR